MSRFGSWDPLCRSRGLPLLCPLDCLFVPSLLRLALTAVSADLTVDLHPSTSSLMVAGHSPASGLSNAPTFTLIPAPHLSLHATQQDAPSQPAHVQWQQRELPAASILHLPPVALRSQRTRNLAAIERARAANRSRRFTPSTSPPTHVPPRTPSSSPSSLPIML